MAAKNGIPGLAKKVCGSWLLTGAGQNAETGQSAPVPELN